MVLAITNTKDGSRLEYYNKEKDEYLNRIVTRRIVTYLETKAESNKCLYIIKHKNLKKIQTEVI